jgi:NAD(P)-dependent dehydrogenase (short-subunit alcohol dehydrogenase family)
VRVTTVSPGPVATDLWLGGGGVAETVGAATGNDPAAVADQAVAATATRRFTRPDEVAALVAQLAGGRTPNLTGVEIVIDGGLTQSL